MTKMRLKSIPDRRPNIGFQRPEVFDRLWGQNDLEAHSGQVIARIFAGSKLSNNDYGQHITKRKPQKAANAQPHNTNTDVNVRKNKFY